MARASAGDEERRRGERLAAALRENLKRRKAQQRGRQEVAETAPSTAAAHQANHEPDR
jgi:hypothetical protein